VLAVQVRAERREDTRGGSRNALSLPLANALQPHNDLVAIDDMSSSACPSAWAGTVPSCSRCPNRVRIFCALSNPVPGSGMPDRVGESRLLCAGPKTRNAAYGGFDLIGRDQPRALELARRVGVARAAHEIVAIERCGRVIPTGIADVVVDDPIGREEFVGRVGQPADHDHRGADRPGKP
jgi:hypothetical protein